MQSYNKKVSKFLLCKKFKKEVCQIVKKCNDLKINTSSIYDLWINYFCLKEIIDNKN